MEKRERPRRKTRLPVRFGAQRAETMGLITDVSTRGVFISTNAVLPPGTPVHVEVRVAGGEVLALQGRVMRAWRVSSAFAMMTAGGMGVRLEHPPANWRASMLLPDEA